MFEVTRDRITVFTDFSIEKYYIYIYVLLLLIIGQFMNKKQKYFKKRILFILFKRTLRRRQNKLRLRFSNYNRLIKFVSTMNNRFLSYCDLVCQKFSYNLLSLLMKKTALFTKTLPLNLSCRIKVENIFSMLERTYVYI